MPVDRGDRPDPGAASSAAEFVIALNQLRAWAGQPSLRTLTALAGKVTVSGRASAVLPASTLSDQLSGKRLPTLPRLAFVEAFVAACLKARGDADAAITTEVDRWQQAWRELSGDAAASPPDSVEEPTSEPGPAPVQAGMTRRLVIVATAVVALVVLAVVLAGTSWTATPTATVHTRRTPAATGSTDRSAAPATPPASSRPTPRRPGPAGRGGGEDQASPATQPTPTQPVRPSTSGGTPCDSGNAVCFPSWLPHRTPDAFWPTG